MLSFKQKKETQTDKEAIAELELEIEKLKQDNLTLQNEFNVLKFRFETPAMYKVTQKIENEIITSVEIKKLSLAEILMGKLTHLKPSYEYTLFNTKTGQTKKCNEQMLTELFNN